MTEDEIEGHIEAINTQKRKTINIAYDKNKKLLQSIAKHTEKIKEGCKKLIEETDPQLTEEGVQKITKKGKIYFRSLKAINAFAHSVDGHFSDFKVPDASHKMTSSELNQFIRVLSRLINEVAREKNVADSIMGLDFMIKKRIIYVPLSKLGSDLNKIRDLQKEEYIVVKALEDLIGLSTDVKDILKQIDTTKEELNALQNEYEVLGTSNKSTEKEYTLLLENPLIQESRKRGIRMTELEIEIGRHLNSFKKIFKKYTREVQRGTFSGEFGLVNTALAYEKNPVQRFLGEEAGSPEIVELLEELVRVGESNLHLKQKNINNLNRELENIKQGIMDLRKKEWHDILAAKENDEASSEFKTINAGLKKHEKELQALKDELIEKEDEIALKNKEISQLSESLSERRERAAEIEKAVLEIQD